MPPPLVRYARRELGPCQVLSWPRDSGPSRVVEVRDTAGRRWFAKRLHFDRLWRGEMQGHRWWQDLGTAVPRLRAHDPDLQALITAPAAGAPASPEDPATLTAAGALLGRLHGAREPVRDPAAWLAAVRSALDFELERCRRAGRAVPPRLVTTALGGLAELDELPSVPTHGDFLPHNWSVDADGAVATMDFAESALRPAAYDVARLVFGPAWQRPELLEQFLDGYGRALTDAEQRFVRLHLVVNAATAIGWGSTFGVETVRDRGHEVIAWLETPARAPRRFLSRG